MSSDIDKILRDLDSKNPVDQRTRSQSETKLSGQANTGPARLIVLILAIAIMAAAAGAMFFFVS